MATILLSLLAWVAFQANEADGRYIEHSLGAANKKYDRSGVEQARQETSNTDGRFRCPETAASGGPERVVSVNMHAAHREREVGNVELERVTDPPGKFE